MKNLYFIIIFSFLGATALVAQGDNCADAVAIACGDAFTGQLGSTDNSDDLASSCVATMGAPVWYSIVGTGDDITVTATPIGWDNELGVYDAACGATDLTTCVGGVDAGLTDDPEIVTFTSVPGTVYLIAVGHWGQGNASDAFDISVTCAPPPPLCPAGFVAVSSGSYCYDENEVDVVVTEACPSSATETVCVTVQEGAWENTFDSVTFYEGAAGSGTGGTIVSGPTDGDVSGTQICASAPGVCITIVSNSDGSVSCASGSQASLEFTVCESQSVVSDCEADNGVLTIQGTPGGN